MKEDNLIHELQGSLQQAASPKTRDWWEKYMRDVIPFRGVGIPEIRRILMAWREQHGISNWTVADQTDLALKLFESGIAEDKLAGILFLQDYLYDRLPWQEMLDRYARLYQQGLIFDWNTCDWFCVRVLGPTIQRHGMDCASAVNRWMLAENLWQARSSVVAFVPVVDDPALTPLILEACTVLIAREERFAKTAVGWILRDLSKSDRDLVRQFVALNLASFTLETIRNALKYFDEAERKDFLIRRKAL